MTLTVERLRDVLHYDPVSGIFTWRVATAHRNKVGGQAGSDRLNGYRSVTVDGKPYLEHRLAWFYACGVWPRDQIDHANGVRSDNRLVNLREATSRQNAQNLPPKGGKLKGANLHKQTGKWRAAIRVSGRQVHLGLFTTAGEAHAAYRAAARQHFGEFARTD